MTLLKNDPGTAKGFEKAIREIREMLQRALMVELSTIPPYATACYSIQERGQYDRSDPELANAEPIEVIRQVMVEEMLHMVLVANVLNAVGGEPRVIDAARMLKYPRHLFGDSGPELRLRRFDPDQVKSFREVERAPPNLKRARAGKPITIGGFYALLKIRLKHACDTFGEAKVFGEGKDAAERRKRQIGEGDYYGAGGAVIEVHDRATAETAIDEIMEEGEGAHHGDTAGDNDPIPGPKGENREDIAHFFKFDEILHSRYYCPEDRRDEPPTGDDMIVDWSAVWPMKDDPKGGDYKHYPEIHALSERFNGIYSELLDGLDDAFNGKKERLAGLVPVMFRLKDAAQKLMRVPLPGSPNGETAGPTWEYRPRARVRGKPGKS